VQLRVTLERHLENPAWCRVFLLRYCSSREISIREEQETPFTDILYAALERIEPGAFLRITVSVET
jgi:hypothetical protein